MRCIVPKLILLLLLLLGGSAVGQANPSDTGVIGAGAGSFVMPEATGVTPSDLRVFYYRPADWTPARPIVIILHGVQRNAEEYRDTWRQYGDRDNLLVVCPEFSADKYPGSRYYNTGNITNSDKGTGHVNPREQWVFSAIDRVFGEVRARSGAVDTPFILFGHSAGAQLVHRYILFSTASSADRIIAANAGWYTMPDRNVSFPYGLNHLPLSDADLTAAFARPVTILLGDKDVNPHHKALRHNAPSDAQGLNRFERGQRFFAMAREKAAELGVPFAWKLVIVPGVGHDDAGMAAAAARLIDAGELKGIRIK